MQQSESKHFLKGILLPPIHAYQLRIPEEFISRFGNELSTDHDATITVPDGCVWNMGLKRCGKKVFFCNNWEEFAKYYCIGYGSYVVFKYEGNSKFSVVIFDATSTEISYPFNKTRSTNAEPNYTNCPIKRSNVEISDADLPSEDDDDGEQIESRCNHNQNVHTKSASERAKNAANEFKPKNASFTSTIKRLRVHIPAEISDADFPSEGTNGNGEPNYINCPMKRSNAEISDADFPSEGDDGRSNAEISDADFPSEGDDGRSNAEISDADFPSEGNDGNQVESQCRMPKSASERAKDAANEFKPKNPSFTSTITTNKATKRAYVPAEFASKHLEPKVPVKLQNSNGEQWQVSCTLNNSQSSSLIISRGFAKFARDNDLSEGDTCVFELINKRKPVVLQVTAFRAVDYGN